MIEQFLTNTFVSWALLIYFGWTFFVNALGEMNVTKFVMVVFSLFIWLFAVWNLFFK